MFDLVELKKINPRILLDIRYATSNNFIGHAVYSSSHCFLVRKTAERLSLVQEKLESIHLGLKIFDGYRPLTVQKIFWELVPDSRYVADPAEGSKHNRGASVDVTLVDKGGCELLMPTGYDDFTEKAGFVYKQGPKEAIENRELLRKVMCEQGFLSTETEWWHYDDPEWEKYPLRDVSFDDLLLFLRA
jgi:D-alanyl-D-alanine dipeptidase